MLRPDRAKLRQRGGLIAAISAEAAARDADGRFPAAAFAALDGARLIGHPPLEQDDVAELLHLLADIGRGDLSVGRIYEGHVNALLLIRSFGTAKQIRRYADLAERGGLFGVWNTDAPDDPLRLESGRLLGRKAFASGVDGLSHAIVTIAEAEGRRMIVAPLMGLPVDRSWWRPLGMRASGSHLVDFTGVAIEPDWLLGEVGDYVRQPWFAAGAIRFCAVQAGGMHAVFDTALQHLRDAERAGAPYQAHRIARMGVAVETSYGWLDRAAEAWAAVDDSHAASGERAIAVADATRAAIEECALAVLEAAERAVGMGGLLAPHPLERRMRDLRTYLRQPDPDGSLAALGDAITAGRWSPGHGRAGPGA